MFNGIFVFHSPAFYLDELKKLDHVTLLKSLDTLLSFIVPAPDYSPDTFCDSSIRNLLIE